MTFWYAVHTHSRSEQKALAHLARQGFSAYLPQFLKQRSHARCRDWVPAPLFPRYLFVAFDRHICYATGDRKWSSGESRIKGRR